MAASDLPHRKTVRHYDDPSHAHYLTFSCLRCQPFLSGRHAPLWLIDSIEAARSSQPFDLWAWVFMPEHVHLLIWPQEGIDVQHILHAIKQPVARAATRWVRQNRPEFLVRMRHERKGERWVHRFWQRGPGYDRNVWSPREIHEKIRYIHNNPVRRGLVDHPDAWPWSSWRAWEEDAGEPMRIDAQSVPLER
jgi:putative transposase